MFFANDFIHYLITVSYTHLDVYKRQVYRIANSTDHPDATKDLSFILDPAKQRQNAGQQICIRDRASVERYAANSLMKSGVSSNMDISLRL